MRNQTLTLLCILLLACSHVFAQGVDAASGSKKESHFTWPDGAVAAVCLTYDDGLDCHLDLAAPDLESHGFRGTFYCHGASGSLAKRTDEWRALAKRGHELGNHSLFHPCMGVEGNGKKREWIVPEYAMENYTVRRMKDELWVANTLLRAVDGKKERTYGYTCSESDAGGKSFIPEVKKLFPGARGVGPVPNSMAEFDCYYTPSFMVIDHPAADLIAQAEEAARNGTVATLMFHSVGGGHLNVSKEAHREFLGYLKRNRARFYVAPFVDVINWVQKSR
ncbi:polysaccharide deacetylase family protein [Adhaeretor mobilis]|uniref:Polysaccharide deacetylase n=1 Tax=Adhaeretor mobilis TaxID=1930276 RepID=A0A517N124_9BACT|nr:polysaccharide deacetylase family protein [Adhaeretor mobilis]QDT00841.1 Polysaccharide deacetylase [Adhaeretor mobilis]